MRAVAGGMRMGKAILAASWMLPILIASGQVAGNARTDKTTTGTVAVAGTSASAPRVLSVFTNGIGKGMHAVYTHANFDALMHPNGYVLIHPKVKGARVGKPLTMGLFAYYVTHVMVGRSIVSFENDKGPLTNPAEIVLTGKLEDDVDYTVIFQFLKNTVSVRGYGNEPAGLKHPTTFRLGIAVPAYTNFPPETLQAEREAKLRGLNFVIRRDQKKTSYPYANGAVFIAPAEKCWIDGPVYGIRKVSFDVKSPDTAPMNPYIYEHTAPHKGYFVGMYKKEIGSKKLSERLVVTIE